MSSVCTGEECPEAQKIAQMFSSPKSRAMKRAEPTHSEWVVQFRQSTKAKLDTAYARIPDNLHEQYPLPWTRKAKPADPDFVARETSHMYLRQLALRLGEGFPRIQCKHRLQFLKSKFKQRFVNPHNELFPKLIEVRSRDQGPPPDVGSYVEIDQLVPAKVLQVGGFSSLRHWEQFPFWGKGGVGLEKRSEIHEMEALSEEAFNKKKIWWALLLFQ